MIFNANVSALEGLLGARHGVEWWAGQLGAEIKHFRFVLLTSDGADVNKRT